MRFSPAVRALFLGLLPLFAFSCGEAPTTETPVDLAQLTQERKPKDLGQNVAPAPTIEPGQEPEPAIVPEEPANAPLQALPALLPITITPGPLGWRTSDRDSARRVALVIGASSAQDPTAALKGAKPAAEELSRLLELLGYGVKTLTGEDVTPGRIEDEIKLLTAGMKSAGNHLIVTWIGHGYKEDGAQVFSHALSSFVEKVDEKGDTSEAVDQSLAYNDLLGWVSASQTRVANAGGELSTLMWIDACRDGGMGFGSASFSRSEAPATVQVFSAGPGKRGFTNENGLPFFTSGLVNEMKRIFQPPGGAKGRKPIELSAMLKRAMENSPELRSQEPEWLGRNGLDQFLLYDPAHLSITLRAVDAETREPIDGATLTFQGVKRSGSSKATFDGLIPSADGYYWKIHAPGYFRRSNTVGLPEVKSGKIMDVPLSPAFIAVEGSVILENGAGKLLTIRLEGLDPPSEQVTLTGQGRYRLLAAPGADACELVMHLGNTELRREPLSLRTLASPRRVGDIDIQVVVRDPLRLTTSAPTPPGAGMVERTIGLFDVSFDFSSLTRDDFYTGWRTYGDIRDYANGEKYESALRVLKTLGDDNLANVKDAARQRFESLKAELEFSSASQNANALREEAIELRRQNKPREAHEKMDHAINLLAEQEPAHGARVRPILTSWLLVSVQNWHSLGEYERSLEQLERSKPLEYDAQALADQYSTITTDWFQFSFDRALKDGDWTTPRTIVLRARQAGMAESTVDGWETLIARDAISSACRAALERGKDHHLDGHLKLARSAYIEALADPTVTESYREEIVALALQMEDDLYDQYKKVAAEKREKDPAASLQAYLKLVQLETTLEQEISLLLKETPELKEAEGMQTYRARAGWRKIWRESRQKLARGSAMESFVLIEKAMGAGPHDREGAELMLARAMVKAKDSGERSRMAEIQASWGWEAKRIMGEIEQAIDGERWRVAEKKLGEAGRIPRVNTEQLRFLDERLAMAAKKKKETDAAAALTAIGRLIAVGRFDDAEQGLKKARRKPGVDSAQLEHLRNRLATERYAIAERERTKLLAKLKDREAYARLGKEQVEKLTGAVQKRWPSQFSGFSLRAVEKFSAGGSSHWVSIWFHDQTGLQFVLVPGGQFQMGSPTSESTRFDDEKQRWVTLDPFLIARTECTQKAWTKMAQLAGLKSAPSRFKGSNQFPVEKVSWDEAEKWCRTAGLQLPGEAQWESACRAGTTTAYAYGASLSPGQAHVGKGRHVGPKKVGSFAPNAFGMFDVHGNVWEWCRDDYLNFEGSRGAKLEQSKDRVYRGGSFDPPSRVARSASRFGLGLTVRRPDIGFRPSLELPL